VEHVTNWSNGITRVWMLLV